MKRNIFIFAITVMLFSIAGCSNDSKEKQESETVMEVLDEDYEIDYEDAASFEKDLNEGIDVIGKVVKFDVVEYKPDSILGINCYSGEHLNFISDNELNVCKGDIVVGRVTQKASQTLGSWKIIYEVLDIEKKEEDKKEKRETEEEKKAEAARQQAAAEEVAKQQAAAEEAARQQAAAEEAAKQQAAAEEAARQQAAAEEAARQQAAAEEAAKQQAAAEEAARQQAAAEEAARQQAAAEEAARQQAAAEEAARQQAEAQAQNQQSNGSLVWISDNGTKYHRNSGCSAMKNNVRQVSVDEAKRLGHLEPCKKCY